MSIKAFKARKLCELTESETVASVNSWQQNLEFHIASCDDFAPFINITWGPKSVRNRGLTDDSEGGSKENCCTKVLHTSPYAETCRFLLS